MAGIAFRPFGPEKRDLNAFLQWFECGFHSMVIDICDNKRLRHTDI